MAYTQMSSLSIDQAAYDRLAYFAYRPENYYDAVCTVRATKQAMPGSSVIFTKISDLAVATTALTETTDVTAVAMADSQVTVTLLEYGNAVITTAKLRGTSFIEVDPLVANVVGYNAGVSIDTIARTVVEAGSNVRFVAASRIATVAADKLTANHVRRALADLRGANVPTISNGKYVAHIHPDVSYDLRAETGAAAWRDPHTYSDPSNIWVGEIGAFEGFKFIEHPRAPLFPDAGATSSVDVYGTLFLGAQGIAKAHSTQDGNGSNPRIIPGPVTDTLRRFVPMGWYHLVGYGRFREESIRRVESSSTIGAN